MRAHVAVGEEEEVAAAVVVEEGPEVASLRGLEATVNPAVQDPGTDPQCAQSTGLS